MPAPVLAAQFSDLTAAHLACGMLLNAGIEATVVNDEMATLYGAGPTWAPVKLYVDASAIDKALALLRQHGDI